MSPFVLSVAHANTIRARCASAWAVVGRRAHCSSVSRSSVVRTTGGVGRPVRMGVLRVYPKNTEGRQFVSSLPTQDTSRLLKKRGKGSHSVAMKKRRWSPKRGNAWLSWRYRPLHFLGALYRSCNLLREIANPHQVVDCQAEHKHPADASPAPVSRLPQQADRLEPAEDLFDPLALLLAHLVAGVARGALIDRTRSFRVVLRDRGGPLEQPEGLDEVARVIGFVGAHGHPPALRPRA